MLLIIIFAVNAPVEHNEAHTNRWMCFQTVNQILAVVIVANSRARKLRHGYKCMAVLHVGGQYICRKKDVF